ncbi:hypothetical protein ACP70R_008383 [Stipagrostis hirtigluma subsp. patula]
MPERSRCTMAYSPLVRAYLARYLFDEMQRYKRFRGRVVSWNVVITGCARCGQDDVAVWCLGV